MVSGLLFLSGVFEHKIYSAAGLSQLDLMRLWMLCPTTHWSRHMFAIISLIQPVVCCQQCVWPQVVPSFAPRFYNRIVQERLEIFTCSLKSFKLHSFISLFWTLSSFDLGEDRAHMPNTVTYHELIGALLKTGKENHRTLILPSEHANASRTCTKNRKC